MYNKRPICITTEKMGTPAKEPRSILRAIRFTVKEDFHIQRMMAEEDYLSVSKYIRDKALSGKEKKDAAARKLNKVVDAIRKVGEAYNKAVELFTGRTEVEAMVSTLVSLTRELKGNTEKVISIARTLDGLGDDENSNKFMLQKIEIIGTVFTDAELKQSKSGNQYVSFTVVVRETFGEEKKSTFYDVNIYRPGIANYVKKGRQIYVSGRLSLSAVCKDGKAYLNAYISANEIDFLSKED